MESHRVAVLSDTHGLLRPEVLERVKTCECILHAGDFGSPEILERLAEICPVYGVRGNVDGDWAGDLPWEREVTLAGFRIYMIHNGKQISRKLSGMEMTGIDVSGMEMAGMDIVICGHSHKYEERREGGILYLNPGSCGPRRFRLPVTMTLLTLYPEAHRAETEKLEWEASGLGKPEQDMHKLVKTIMKEVRAGRTVAQIAARNHIQEELAEQICRFYVTHPGVDVDGILDRMERKNL